MMKKLSISLALIATLALAACDGLPAEVNAMVDTIEEAVSQPAPDLQDGEVQNPDGPLQNNPNNQGRPDGGPGGSERCATGFDFGRQDLPVPQHQPRWRQDLVAGRAATDGLQSGSGRGRPGLGLREPGGRDRPRPVQRQPV